MFVVYALLTQKEAQFAYDGIKKWFKKNPNRDDCVTESFVVRRDHIKEDILKNSEKGVVLKEKAPKKKLKKAKKAPKKVAKKTTKKAAKKAK